MYSFKTCVTCHQVLTKILLVKRSKERSRDDIGKMGKGGEGEGRGDEDGGREREGKAQRLSKGKGFGSAVY